jgi:hypothetical protein
MAVSTGTATDYKDLLSRLRTFLTGMAVAGADRPWTSLRYTVGGAGLADELILRAPGSGGTDQIFVGITTFENATADYYNWRLMGCTGYDGSLTFAGQPGVMQNVFFTLWNSPIPYTFVANGRRCVVVAQISSSWVMLYLGFINQYPSPAQYPYPLLVGGNMAWETEPAGNSTSWRWSQGDNRNHNFPFSNFVNTGGGLAVNTMQMRLRSPAGVWLGLKTGDNGAYFDGGTNIWPYMAGMANLQQNLGATPQSPAMPIILHDPSPEVFGELDGVVATSGQGVASGDLLSISGVDHLVVQDVFRTSRERYCAVRKL